MKCFLISKKSVHVDGLQLHRAEEEVTYSDVKLRQPTDKVTLDPKRPNLYSIINIKSEMFQVISSWPSLLPSTVVGC